MPEFRNNAIFWIEVEKINPNPYQPRKEFDEARLRDLADSIRQYGVLQPLVVTRKEIQKDDGGIVAEYELIAGERRLRASRIAGVKQVPVLIKEGDENDQLKLELAIIENLQREDLNPVDRALAFQRLANEFKFKHIEIAKKVGKSREYVSNSLRLLTLPEDILASLAHGKITEGHARPLMMLNDRPEEQSTLYKEIVFKKLTVRETEAIARGIAKDKIRKKPANVDPEILNMEKQLTESLGTRVSIEKRSVGGKVVIDFFSNDDLRALLELVATHGGEHHQMSHFMKAVEDSMANNKTANNPASPATDTSGTDSDALRRSSSYYSLSDESEEATHEETPPSEPSGDSDAESDLYSLKNFTV